MVAFQRTDGTRMSAVYSMKNRGRRMDHWETQQFTFRAVVDLLFTWTDSVKPCNYERIPCKMTLLKPNVVTGRGSRMNWSRVSKAAVRYSKDKRAIYQWQSPRWRAMVRRTPWRIAGVVLTTEYAVVHSQEDWWRYQYRYYATATSPGEQSPTNRLKKVFAGEREL